MIEIVLVCDVRLKLRNVPFQFLIVETRLTEAILIGGKGNIEESNRSLAADPSLAGSQVKRFLILHKMLDADDGELTRTGKIRRKIVFERYDDLIEALYSDKDLIPIEAKVTFENGKEGVIKAELKIRDTEVYSSVQKAS